MPSFDDVDIPRWHELCKKALPNFEVLSPRCKGALVSLAYNRGITFSKKGDRYTEMRNIRAQMANKDFDKIPAEFRKMRRLWTNKSNRGVALRREHEARLKALMAEPRRFPPPWSVEEPDPKLDRQFIVRDGNGQPLKRTVEEILPNLARRHASMGRRVVANGRVRVPGLA